MMKVGTRKLLEFPEDYLDEPRPKKVADTIALANGRTVVVLGYDEGRVKVDFGGTYPIWVLPEWLKTLKQPPKYGA